MKESAIEQRLVREVTKRGGIAYKFESPGNPGVPDRLVITPAGHVFFVELKTKVGRLAEMQKWQHRRIVGCHGDVRTLYGVDEVIGFVKEVFG